MTASSWFWNNGKERVRNDAYDHYGWDDAAYACDSCLYDGQQCDSGERYLLYGNNASREMAWRERGKEHPRRIPEELEKNQSCGSGSRTCDPPLL